MRLTLTFLLILGLVACNNKTTGFQSQNESRQPAEDVQVPEYPTDPSNPTDPENPGVITKGSFTVWTEPSTPTPLKPYYILIKINLPNDTSNYTQNDLSGSVTGTDKYFRTIEGGVHSTTGVNNWSSKAIELFDQDNLVVNGDTAVFSMLIPGAVMLVKDTIRVRSELLNEEQTISIIFQ